MLDVFARRAARIFPCGSTRSHHSQFALLAAAPATAGTGGAGFDPVFLVCGLAVLSAGLVVLHAAQSLPRRAPAMALAGESRRLFTADEALAERDRLRETSVLVDALAEAAATFYAIAGQLPQDASERVVQRADDLRELVWQNRTG